MSTLDLFLQPAPPPPPPRLRRVEPRRPGDEELASLIHLEHDDYRDAYRREWGCLPDAHAWRLWYHEHDRAVLKRDRRRKH